jgi:hypothetical protein
MSSEKMPNSFIHLFESSFAREFFFIEFADVLDVGGGIHEN